MADAAGIFQSLVTLYELQAREAYFATPDTFEVFASRYPRLKEIGDRRLARYDGTAYNLLPEATDLDLESSEPLIFYSNYLGRPRHFGLVLAEMEQQGIITHDQVTVGVKASKTLYGGWPIDPGDEVVDTIDRTRTGVTTPAEVTKTVETVVTFRPRDAANAQAIGAFLIRRCNSRLPGAIPGSWDVPDIRATQAAWSALEHTGRFRLVTANLFVRPDGTAELVIGRQRSRFGLQWRSVGMVMNAELAQFLAGQGVRP